MQQGHCHKDHLGYYVPWTTGRVEDYIVEAEKCTFFLTVSTRYLSSCRDGREVHFSWTASARVLSSCGDGQEVHFSWIASTQVLSACRELMWRPFSARRELMRRSFSACRKMVRRALFACGDVVLKSFSISQAMLWVTINWKSATHGVTKCWHGCGWSMP